MTWQLLTMVSVVTFSVSVLLQRILLHRDKSDPVAYAIVFQGMVGVLFGLYALAVGFQMPDFKTLWFPVLAAIILYGSGHVAYAKTLQRVEASVFSILFATYVFWVMIFGVTLFNEHLDIAQLLGALLIFVSICLVAERRGTIRLDRGIILGLFTGLLFGLATTAWVYVGREADAVSWNAISFIGPSLLVLAGHPGAIQHMKPLFRGDTLKRILLLAVFFCISTATLLLAFQTGNASVVAPLHATTTIVTVLLAVAFLRERSRLRWKTAAAVVCFMGVLLIV